MTAANDTKRLRDSVSQVDKILRGIDNDATEVCRLKDKIEEKLTSIQKANVSVRSILNGITNEVIQQYMSPATVVQVTQPSSMRPPSTDVVVPVDSKKKPQVQKPDIKPSMIQKTVNAPPSIKPEPKQAPKIDSESVISQDGRPYLKSVVMDTLNGGKHLTAGVIYKSIAVVADAGGFKVWSRQSLYNTIDRAVKLGEILKVGDGAEAVYSTAASVTTADSLIEDNDEEISAKLIEKVSQSTAVLNVT